jgi:hypothetical protein
MRTTSWPSVLLFAYAACGETPQRTVQQSAPQHSASPRGGLRTAGPIVVSNRNENGHTRLELQVGDSRRDAILLARDSTVGPDAEASGIDVMAEVPGVAIVMVDRYASIPGGLSLCQAGEEHFLRVVSIAGDKPLETFATKVASCRDSIELAERGLEWDAPTSTIRIHWLTGPTGKPEVRAIRVGSDGRVQATS